MKLSGKQIKEIQEALLDAFPAKDDLRMMVRIELDETLEAIADGTNQRVVIFNLVSWAERTGHIDRLIAGALRQNPGNPAMERLAAEWRTEAVPRTSTPSAMPSGPVSIDLFLSYSRKDSDAMRPVQEALRATGLAVWTDEGLEPGTQSWQDAISEAVNQAQAMVVLLSPNSSQSTWVKNEIGFAQAHNKRIFPVLIAGDPATAIPISLINAQWVDGRENLRQAVTQGLLPVLRQHLQLTAPVSPPTGPVVGTDVVGPAPVEPSKTLTPTPAAGKRTVSGKPYLIVALIVLAVALVGMLVAVVTQWLPFLPWSSTAIVPPANLPIGHIINLDSGRCIDVQGEPGTDNESRLQLFDCEYDNPSSNQIWQFTTVGLIKNMRSGRCIDALGYAMTTDETPLQLYDCVEFDPVTDQRWDFTRNSFIKNRLSGKCIDVKGKPGTASGLPLQLWECEYNDPGTDQRWEVK